MVEDVLDKRESFRQKVLKLWQLYRSLEHLYITKNENRANPSQRHVIFVTSLGTVHKSRYGGGSKIF